MNTYIFIHGGESFVSYENYIHWIQSTLVEWNIESYSPKDEKKKWKIELAKKLYEKGNTVYLPNFPNPQNAKYKEWKIFFDTWIRKVPLHGEVSFIGSSLGGNFLLTYFGEIDYFPHEIGSIHLLAACQECGDFPPPNSYEYLQKLTSHVHIWHAEDDVIVPFSIGQELAKILPKAETHFFPSEKGYGHFHGIERIPELEDTIFLKKI